MHIHPDQPHFVRCPKCVAKQKAREDALKDMLLEQRLKSDEDTSPDTNKGVCECLEK